MRVLWSITEESRTRKAELKGGWNMGLFEPAWKNRKLKPGDPKHRQKIVNSINKLGTEEELLEVLCTSPLESARIEALDRLSTERALRFALEQFPEGFSDGLYDPSSAKKRIANRILMRIIQIPPWDNKRLRESDFQADEEVLSTLKHLVDESQNSAVRDAAYDRYHRLVDYQYYCMKMSSPEGRFRMAETAAERVEALKECRDEKVIIGALYDNEYLVREEAIRRVRDHHAFVQWILSGSVIIPIGAETFQNKFDELDREVLETLINGLQKIRSEDVSYEILLKRTCRKLGHIPGGNCFCIRCGEELPHNFDENGVCKICRARYVEEEEILTEARVQYAKRTNRRIEYPDGRVKHLDPETRILVDDSTMRWLFPNE